MIIIEHSFEKFGSKHSKHSKHTTYANDSRNNTSNEYRSHYKITYFPYISSNNDVLIKKNLLKIIPCFINK